MMMKRKWMEKGGIAHQTCVVAIGMKPINEM